MEDLLRFELRKVRFWGVGVTSDLTGREFEVNNRAWTMRKASAIVRYFNSTDEGQNWMGLLNLLPKEDQYFDLFKQMTLYIVDAARELKQMLADKQPSYT